MQQYIEFAGNHPYLFAALIGILVAIGWFELRRFTRGYKDISPSQAVQLINHGNALLLDVREDNEVSTGKIQGAKHIALGILKQRIDDLKDYKSKPVIAYCRSGTRSSQACDMLTKNNFENVYELKGGLIAWENANLPVTKK